MKSELHIDAIDLWSINPFSFWSVGLEFLLCVSIMVLWGMFIRRGKSKAQEEAMWGALLESESFEDFALEYFEAIDVIEAEG